MQKAAFFDIDNTLYPGTLAVDFVKQLKLNPLVLKIIKSSGLDQDADVVAILKALQKSSKMPYRLYLEITDQVANKAKGKFNQFSLDLFQKCRQEGFAMIAVSQAPFMILKRYCQDILGDSLDVIISPMPTTKLNGDNELVIGERSVISTDQRSKKDWLKAIAECYGFDLSKSIAIGDSASDIPMLEAVGGRKIAFNPDQDLRSKAELEGWEIIEEVKLKEE